MKLEKKNQMNQTEFSNRVGVSQGTLSELEHNTIIDKKEAFPELIGNASYINTTNLCRRYT